MEKNLSNFENIKANTIKTKNFTTTTLSTNLLESNITVIEDKAFIGFIEKDQEVIKNLSSNNNNSLYVKNNINALNSISCGDKIYIGYTDFSNLNADTNLHVKGDSEINGNLYVYNDIVVNKNLYTCCNLNVGYDNIETINNDYILNVNGQSFFKDNIYCTKSILIEDNIVANKESYLNSIFLNTNIKLDNEIIENINITLNSLSSDDKLLLINNIINSLNNLKDFTFNGIAYNNGDDTFNNGIASVSKKIIVNKQKYYVFLLVNFISHPKIKTIINPISDSLTIIDSDFNKIDFNKIDFDKSSPNPELKYAIIPYVKPNINVDNFNKKKNKDKDINLSSKTKNSSSKTTNSSSKNIINTNNKKINKKKFNMGFLSNFNIFNKLKTLTNKFYSKDNNNSDDSSDEYEQIN
jgi:hypothetical protein